MNNVNSYSNTKLALAAKMLLAIASTSILLVPCILLFLIEPSKGFQVVVSCTSVLVFSFTISVFTKARMHEVFLAAAAYAAVLVVFLGTQPNGGQKS